MFSTTIPREDLSVGEVAEALRRGLGPRYRVTTGVGVNVSPLAPQRADRPNEIIVSRGSSRLLRVGVAVSRSPGRTVLEVRAGALTVVPWLLERVWVGRPVMRVLQSEFSQSSG